MGSEYEARCRKCGRTFSVSQGGGFSFYLLRCEKCGKEKSVSFEELRDLNRRDLNSFSVPHSVATAVRDEEIRETAPGPPPLIDSEIETLLRKHRCGGHFRFDSPPRYPKCRSTEVEVDESGPTVMYD